MSLRYVPLRVFGSAILFALAVCTSGDLCAQAAPAPTAQAPDQLRTLTRDELDVVKVLTRQEDAWNKGDLDTFVSGYKNAPDILFVGRQITRGYSQMVSDYKHDYPNKEAMGQLSYSELEPRVLDDHYAVLVGHYKLERGKKFGGNADGAFSEVLEKTPDGWKIIVDHTT